MNTKYSIEEILLADDIDPETGFYSEFNRILEDIMIQILKI